jgi:hypothetical protein
VTLVDANSSSNLPKCTNIYINIPTRSYFRSYLVCKQLPCVVLRIWRAWWANCSHTSHEYCPTPCPPICHITIFVNVCFGYFGQFHQYHIFSEISGQGTYFTNFACPWTLPICSCKHESFHLGLTSASQESLNTKWSSCRQGEREWQAPPANVPLFSPM